MSGSNSSARDLPPAAHADARPDEPLGLTVHSLPAPDLTGERQRTASGRLRMLLVLLVCASPVIASYFLYFVVRPDWGRTNYSALILPTVATPDIEARTLEGQPMPLRSLKGQWLLVAVGGGACDESCEKRLYAQRQLREMLGKERDRLDKVWLITDDAPLRAELKDAVTAGVPVTALRVAGDAVAAWLKPEAGRGLADHLYIVDPMGEWMMRVPVDFEPAKVKRDLDRLLRASASWDPAGR